MTYSPRLTLLSLGLAATLLLPVPLVQADNSGGPAATLQVGKINKGGPSHSNLAVGQGQVTFQIGNEGVTWENVTLRVSNGKRVYAEVPLARLAGVQSWSWSVPQGLTAPRLYVTWQGTISAATPAAAERGVKDKGIKGCETC